MLDVIDLKLRHMLGYIDEQTTSPFSVPLWHLAIKCTYKYLGSECEVYAYITQWSSTRWLKCTQIALGISMLRNIFLLHA